MGNREKEGGEGRGGEVSKAAFLPAYLSFLWEKKGGQIDRAIIVPHIFVLGGMHALTD